ncbi:MAG: 2-succinyl-6-hydroxy-2,4-cyclohexadiene-1-carboxylate synthase [Ignavibacteriae bacterium]|nr:2-succinyl-6-hydroxy-2,4-cyclohexadiene-1-carboxylate synthase [Ignavibacteriota bacterium]
MILKIDNLEFNLDFNERNIQSKIPIIFLHGFTGNINDWKFLENKIPQNYSPIFIDLIGHGKTSSPGNAKFYSSKSQVAFLKKIIDELDLTKIIICGYSMGGRLALDFAFEFPKNIIALILESTSFGIEDEIERKERLANDFKLSEQIKNSTIEEFINYWFSLPLFQSLKKLPKDGIEKSKISRAQNSKTGLRNSLIGFSTGKMKNYFQLGNNFTLNILLITGQLDKKFTQIGKSILPNLLNGKLEVINDAGHNTHLEKPEEFLKLINTFLLNIEK